MRRLCERILKASGYAVVSVSSAAEALRLLPGHFSALVTDWQMPDMDGVALVAALRQRGDTIPALLMSGLPNEEALARMEQEGGTFFLRKPFGVQEFLDALAKVLLQNRGHGRLRPPAFSRTSPPPARTL